jgi:predicted nucleic acid-binding protein
MALGKIGQIHLLYPVYGTVLIPSAVYEEAVLDGLARGESDAVRQNILNMSEIDVVFDALLKRDDIWIAESLIRHVWNDLKSKFGAGGG